VAVAAIGAIAVGGSALAGGGADRGTVSAKVASKATTYHYVGKAVDQAPGTQTTIVQACPRGTIPIAGGGGGASETPGEQSLVYSNLADGPDANTKPDSWLVAVDNHSSATLQASVEAICVDR
jgi:hypothetical protein